MKRHGLRYVAAVLAVMGWATTAWAGGTALTTVRVASGLERPVGLTAPNGDFNRVFIIEKPGQIRVMENGTLLGTPFLDIDSLVGGGGPGGDERGLLGLAFHPDYLNNGQFFVNYTNNSGNTVVARYTVDGDPATDNTADPGSATILLSVFQPEGNHNGGWLGFGPNDGYLYIGLGDGGGANDMHGFPGNGQSLNTLLGKMLRINVDSGSPYSVPPDNPFVGVSGEDEIWAYGLRNPWRNAFDSETGDLYIADVGQFSIEEINFQPANSDGGENYGWRCMEGNSCTGNGGCTCFAASLTDPVHTYTHAFGCSNTGGEVYRGCSLPDLDGTYFFADYCTARIWSFRYDGGVTDFEERTSELAPGGGLSINNVTSFGRDGYGEVYIVDQGSSSSNCEVFKIVPASGSPFVDCNSNTVEDGCELADGSAEDGNGNGIIDTCECGVAAPTPVAEELRGSDPCVSDGDCANEAVCRDGICYGPRNRYLGFGPDFASTTSYAIRVTHVGTGTEWWGVPPGPGETITRLGDTPMAFDSDVHRELLLSDCQIVPGEEYDVQVVSLFCDIGEEVNFSAPLRLPTVTNWGDTAGEFDGEFWLPPDGFVNLGDALSIIASIEGGPSAPPGNWVDIEGEVVSGIVNLGDALSVIQSIEGASYPFAAPGDCP